MFGDDPQYQAIADGLKALQKARPVFPSEASSRVRGAVEAAFAPGHKLAASLLAALGPEARRDSLQALLGGLKPDWASLYAGDADPHPQDRALGEAGARAVATFLELVFDAPGSVTWETPTPLPHGMAERELEGVAVQLRWQAAQALEWRFNRFETPGLTKARAFYAAHREAAAPKQPDIVAAELAGLIRNAFRDAPAPAPGDLSGSEEGDEPFEYAVEFRGRDWRGLSVEFLSRHGAALAFFSPAAFRYFIPAYMVHHLPGPRWNADPVFNLTHGFAEADKGAEGSLDWEAAARRRFAVFTPPERAAVAAFLAWCDAHDPFEDPRIREALASYWNR
ncbi:MAG: hypothetical protein FD126_2048 [Elusimicrobia bacterium]|nr:MAG: hypothetical protein FD126_2048 [Elusimicrobiota bacterium]